MAFVELFQKLIVNRRNLFRNQSLRAACTYSYQYASSRGYTRKIRFDISTDRESRCVRNYSRSQKAQPTPFSKPPWQIRLRLSGRIVTVPSVSKGVLCLDLTHPLARV